MKFWNEHNGGFSAIEAMVGLALFGIVQLGVISLFKNVSKVQQRSSIKFGAEIVRNNLIETLRNPVAWKNTVADDANTSLACLKTGSDCYGAGGAILVVRDASNSLFFDLIDKKNGGFSDTGSYCDSFDDKSGNVLCPFQPELTWAAICPASVLCLNPQVRITAKMNFRVPASSYSSTPFNPQHNGFEIILPQANQAAGQYWSGSFPSPNLDTGWLRMYPKAPVGAPIKHVPGEHAFLIDFTKIPHTLGSNTDSYVVDIQYRVRWNVPYQSDWFRNEPSQLGPGSCGHFDSMWRRLTTKSIAVDVLDDNCVGIKNYEVRIRIWDYSV